MKFDLSLSPFDTSVATLVTAARLAETQGFDGVWTYDHVSGIAGDADSVHDPWVVLSAIAAGTERIGLGPLVLNATFRHPAHIAVAAASLQELSGGRLTLGMGAGAGDDRFGRELAMVGLPLRSAAERRARTEEAIRFVRAAWRGQQLLPGHPLTESRGFLRPRPEPRIIVGANGPKMAALAGRAADGVNFHWFEDDLENLAGIARRAADDDRFEITVEAPLVPEWLTGVGRRRVEMLGASRIMYQWNHPLGLDAIREAGDRLRQAPELSPDPTANE
ncbi:MAG TPA: LLM class flavin-dependent oxidoreductase [Acidimicrobiia bacterium]|nr:LLM class flavin-dependent oxidoreductase [Acidimicrobiia bacterium]